jgi:hypothetical protein
MINYLSKSRFVIIKINYLNLSEDKKVKYISIIQMIPDDDLTSIILYNVCLRYLNEMRILFNDS